MKRYKVQIVLIVVIIFLVVVKQKYGINTENTIIFEEIAAPTATATPTIVEKELDPNYPLWDKLPYSGKGFVIDRYTSPLTLVVEIRGLDRKIVEEEVLDWLASQEVATDSHELVWE